MNEALDLGSLLHDVQRAHARAFRHVLDAEARGLRGRERDLAQRAATDALREAWEPTLRARLELARDVLAEAGVARDRFEAMIAGAWSVETFPFLWADLHAMAAQMGSARPLISLADARPTG
jgi:hypothetical protein